MEKPYIYNEEDEQIFLPTRNEVCWGCDGNGTHVNRAIDGNGICPSDEIWQDEDFREGYFSGRYDVICDTCNGQNVVPVVDEDRCDPDLLAEYHRQQKEIWECYQIEAQERAMGA